MSSAATRREIFVMQLRGRFVGKHEPGDFTAPGSLPTPPPFSQPQDTMTTLGLSATGEHNLPTGFNLLADPLHNKGTAFTHEERNRYGLRGMLPPRVFTIAEQEARALAAIRKKSDNLEKYLFLTDLQQRNEVLFYRLVVNNLAEMLPLIYTPTVGQACLEFGAIFRKPRGLYISIKDKGHIREILHNWPQQQVKLIVVTDGQRILGLGDLGALGMGIPIGKLSLYTGCAGVHPGYCLPITLDVGTDNETLLNDPLYLGLAQKRVDGPAYDEFIEEFVTAVQEVFPDCLLQFEDFGNKHAFELLHEYRDRICCFNDDIQGTASVAVAGIISAVRQMGGKLADQKLLFLGAGEAGTGIGELWTEALRQEGLSEAEARERCWFVDSKGLITKSRWESLNDHKRPFAHEHAAVGSFEEAVEVIKPTAIIGVAGMARTFTPEILRKLASFNKTPIVFALSNPTSKAECTAQEAYEHTEGRVIFASGSPFPPVNFGGKTWQTGQCNNVYIFPGVGLGVLGCRASRVTDSMFLIAARTLAEMVTPADLAVGRVYPSLDMIREASARIAVAVAEEAYKLGLAQAARPANLDAAIRECMFQPEYQKL